MSLAGVYNCVKKKIMRWIQVAIILTPMMGCFDVIIFQGRKIVRGLEVLQATFIAMSPHTDRDNDRVNDMRVDIIRKKKK